MTSLTKRFSEQFYGDEDNEDAPSYSTIRRTIYRASMTRTVLERLHHLVDHERRIDFYLRIAHYSPELIVDIDGMACNKAEFQARYGFSPRGEAAFRMQWVIGGHTYNVLAAYMPFGFLVWELFIDETVDAGKFQAFIRGRVKDSILDDAVGLVDNATIHHTTQSEVALEEVFNGRYLFSEPYCCMDKPVELGFSNVKNYLRANEIATYNDPVGMINGAFELYSIRGERGYVAYNHFRHYFENHDYYLSQF